MPGQSFAVADRIPTSDGPRLSGVSGGFHSSQSNRVGLVPVIDLPWIWNPGTSVGTGLHLKDAASRQHLCPHSVGWFRTLKAGVEPARCACCSPAHTGPRLPIPSLRPRRGSSAYLTHQELHDVPDSLFFTGTPEASVRYCLFSKTTIQH